MSILNKQERVSPSKHEVKAQRVKRSARSTTDVLLNSVQSSFKAIWDDENPQGVIDALGTDAQEIFELSSNTVDFLVAELTGKRDEDLAKLLAVITLVQPHTVNADGTITIDSV